jgi:carbon-monoxide dehydrogenase large subunit
MYDAGDYAGSMRQAQKLADVAGFAKRKRDSAKKGKLRGLGY